MQFSDAHIQKFKDAVEKEYGQKMAWEEASESLQNLVGLFDLLYKIDRRENPEKYKIAEDK